MNLSQRLGAWLTHTRQPAAVDTDVLSRSVCILGMHRSGTSAIAETLERAGLPFGPDNQLIPSSGDNPRGHRELRMIMDINETLLDIFGGSWHTPPQLPEDWLQDQRVCALQRNAQTYLTQHFHEAPRWAWKEPRTCLTVPFWRAVLGTYAVVLCVRHPLEVAQSLQTRNQLDLAQGLELWYHYNQQALRDASEMIVVTVQYEQYAADAVATCRRVCKALQLSLTETQLTHVAAGFTPQLRHHHADHEEQSLPTHVRDLYEQLLQMTRH